MSLYCVVDGEDCGQVATVRGWSEFIEWADKQKYKPLAHLAQHGFSTEVRWLGASIRVSLVEDMPSVEIEDTAWGIERICREHPDAGILIVTDGSGDKSINLDDYDDDAPAKKKSARKSANKAPAKKTASRKAPAKKSARKKAAAKTPVKKKAVARKTVKGTAKKPAKAAASSKKTKRR